MNPRELKKQIAGAETRATELESWLTALADARRRLQLARAEVPENTRRHASLSEAIRQLEHGVHRGEHLNDLESLVRRIPSFLGQSNGRLATEEALDETRERIAHFKALLPSAETVAAAELRLAAELLPAAVDGCSRANAARRRFDEALEAAEVIGRELVDATVAARRAIGQIEAHADACGLDATPPALLKNGDDRNADRYRFTLTEVLRDIVHSTQVDRQRSSTLATLRARPESTADAA